MVDDGFGNKIDKIKAGQNLVISGPFEPGDMIYIHNKEGCRIATYKVTKWTATTNGLSKLPLKNIVVI